MKKILPIFLIIFFNFYSSTVIKVGAYSFPPYLNINNEKITGKTVDLIALLNKTQNKYKFELVITSPSRRYLDFGVKFDLMFYEDLDWGWRDKEIENTQLSLKDEEVFISLTDYYNNQDFVKDIKKKKILLIKGFHYAFTGFNTNEDYLSKNFNVVFTNSPQNTMDFLFSGRAHIAIITKSFLTEYLNKNPEKMDSIIINDSPDQTYNLTILKSKNSVLKIDELNYLINSLKKSGNYSNLLGN